MKMRLRATRILLVPVLALALLSHHMHPEGSIWDRLLAMSGLTLLLVAMGGRLWSSAYIAGRKDNSLVTEGPYRLVRNPLYLFSLIGCVGAGLAFESLTLAGIFLGVFLVSHLPTIRAEERTLAELFGQEYEVYRARVPRLIPLPRTLFSRKPGPKVRELDMPRFTSALRDGLAIPMIFVIADLLEWAKLNEVLPVLIELP